MPVTSTAPAIPAGKIAAFGMAAVPSGWLACNGSAVSRATYAALFAVIGTTWGAGDGATTFNLPDMRGEFLRGADGGRGVDAGRAVGSTQAHQFEDHGHGGGQGIMHTEGPSGDNVSGGVDAQMGTITVGAPNSGNHGAETRPRNVAVSYGIKT